MAQRRSDARPLSCNLAARRRVREPGIETAVWTLERPDFVERPLSDRSCYWIASLPEGDPEGNSRHRHEAVACAGE